MSPKDFDQEVKRLVKQLKQLERLSQELQIYVQNSDLTTQNQPHREVYNKLNELIEENHLVMALHLQAIQDLLQQNQSDELTPKTVESAQKLFGELVNQPLSERFDQLADESLNVANIFSQQEEQALIKLEQSEHLDLVVLLGTLLFSGLLATAIALHLSEKIALPLEFTTAVAQRVTETNNFRLVAPVTTNDEVGRLAQALNNLINQIGNYTQELKQTQSQLIQSEKMSGLGQMVAGISHEINNPVNFIHGNLKPACSYVEDLLALIELYQQEYPEKTDKITRKIEDIDLEFLKEDLPKILSSIAVGTERIRQLVLSLRNFSRLDESEVKSVDLQEGIENTLVILNHRLKNIEVIKHYHNLPRIECYPAQLNQVFMNLISNAIDAIESQPNPGHQWLVIETQTCDHNQVIVKIKDCGCGIPGDIQKKIFDPFFTTKEVGKGTGLGLSISYQIVKKHGGQISVQSQIGQGTEFTVILPLTQPKSITPVQERDFEIAA